MEATVRKPRKRKVKVPAAPEVPDVVSVNKEDATAKKPRRRKVYNAKREIVFLTPTVPETKPNMAAKKRGIKKDEAVPELKNAPANSIEKQETPVKSPRKRKAKVVAPSTDLTVAVVPTPEEKVVKSTRKRKTKVPAAEAETTLPETPKPAKKKKATQASWDKWVKTTVVAVSPDVWNIHASELSHNSQFLTDLRKLPTRVLLDTPALDYLFRCPDRLSHNARLVLNEEGVECMVSLESIHEWADKMRTGHYLIDKENGFFDKIFDRFDLESVMTTTEVYQKYVSLKANTFIDISWERKSEDIISTRLNADERPTRIIAAQALVLGVPILSPDLRYEAYKKDGLRTVW
ncbi:hypothetical protein [Persicitalea sp.]|uniref:hypothetical protein n=1 Tax=Persicitalea sp. TaxID=3100273 RepID=UPI003593D476